MNTSISNVITAIQACISSNDRLDAIYDACSKFDHNITTTHDAEIAMGADIALFKHLPLLMIKKQRISHQFEKKLLEDKEARRVKVEKEKEAKTLTMKMKEQVDMMLDCDNMSTGSDNGHGDGNGHGNSNINARTNTNTTTTTATTTTNDNININTNHKYVAILEEISNTFTALEMVLRCSAESISTCYARIGDELLQILIDFIQELSVDLSRVALLSQQQSSSSSGSRSGLQLSPSSQSSTESHPRSRSPTTVTENNTTQQDLDRSSKTSTPTTSCDGEESLEGETTTKEKSSSSKQQQQVPTSPISSTNNPSVQTASTVILKTCTKIIGHFARVGSLTETLANTGGLLDTLCDVITISHNINSNSTGATTTSTTDNGNSSSCSVSSTSTPNETNNNNNNIPIEATLNSLWIIANLACSAENMILMSRNHKITETLFEIASHPNSYEENECQNMDIDRFINLIRTRSVAVRGILNLSWAQENKVPFTENVTLVDDLLRIASHRKSPWAGSGRGVSGILLQSRRHACGTLRNLAAAPRKCKRRLCRLKGGQFLESLADVARNDYDAEVRDKIHATLFNLVSADTAKMFTEKKSVLDVITSAATCPEQKGEDGVTTAQNNRTANTDRGSRKMAENTLRSLEKALPEDDEGYDALRPTLSRFDSQIAMNRSISNLGSVTISVTNLGTLPSISNFSLGDMSHTNINPEMV